MKYLWGNGQRDEAKSRCETDQYQSLINGPSTPDHAHATPKRVAFSTLKGFFRISLALAKQNHRSDFGALWLAELGQVVSTGCQGYNRLYRFDPPGWSFSSRVRPPNFRLTVDALGVICDPSPGGPPLGSTSCHHFSPGRDTGWTIPVHHSGGCRPGQAITVV